MSRASERCPGAETPGLREVVSPPSKGIPGGRRGSVRGTSLTAPGSARRVSLTFDDGPDPTWTPRVLEALREAGARASFFVVAPLARRHPGLIRAIIGNGHRVELHCTRHIRHTELSRHEAEEDVRLGRRDLVEIGAAPALWRPPWGVRAPWTAEVASRMGLDLALWTEDTHDWRGDTADEMLDSIGSGLGPGSVVLMHDGLGPGARRSGCDQTVALVGKLVHRIRELGCEPEPMMSGLGTPETR